MGLGEKITLYRKKRGISQENLAEIIGVSRQSVSLWENNQTIPSMDKLIQLSKVLDISMDELIDRKNKFDTDTKPIASASSNFDKTMIDETLKMSNRRFRTSSIIISIVCAYLLFVFIIDGETKNDSFVVIPIILLVIIGIRYFIYVKKMKGNAYKAIEVDPEKVFSYDFYSDYINIFIKSSNTDSKIQIKYKDFDQVFETENYYMLVYFNRYYSIKKSNIKGDEAFLTNIMKYKMKKYQSSIEKIENQEIILPSKKVSMIKFVSNLLFVLSIFTLPLALVILVSYSSLNGSYSSFAAFEDVWVFLLVLPIPLSSTIIGVYGNRHGLKRKKNIVIGVIMSVLVVLYSSISFFSSLITSHDYQYVNDLETIINFDFPNTGEITTQKQNASSNEITYISESDVLFTNADELYSFDQSITTSDLWTDKISAQNIGMLSTPATFQKDNYDYYLIFNVDLQTYNTLPSVSGSYDIIFIAYNISNHTLKVMEYTLYLDVD